MSVCLTNGATVYLVFDGISDDGDGRDLRVDKAAFGLIARPRWPANGVGGGHDLKMQAS